MNVPLLLRLLCVFATVSAALAEPLHFSATGCGPYKPAEEDLLARHVALVSADGRSEFLVHLGDIVTGARKQWPESQYRLVADILKKSAKPVFVLLGDNEWNDLDNPAEGLAFWNRHLRDFEKHFPSAPALDKQPERSENFAFVAKGVLIIGLNLPGGRVHDPAEWQTRLQHNADWIKVQLGKHPAARAAVVMAQAHPNETHEPFTRQLVEHSRAWAKPILFLHADGHTWQLEPAWRAPNLWRVQTDMVGLNPPVLVTVTDDPAAPFAFDRRISALAPAPPAFSVKLETALQHNAGDFLWFHPRATALPGASNGAPAALMTIQKHLKVSDYYSGLHVMTRARLDSPWTGPVLPPALDWQVQPSGVTISVADVTPGWHAPTGRLLAIGCQVRYSPKGAQLDDVPRAHQTVYAVFDPQAATWTPWRVLALPPAEEFNFARNACSQWLVKPDGTLLVPLYIGKNSKDRFSTTVAECRFDGRELTYLRHGDILRLPVARGLYEPSLIAFAGRYFLTLRNDLRGYVSVSDDGLKFPAPRPWLFDDGADLGSYNTQQHWLAHSDGLFLIYTRRGANNDHIIRHRAPLFMAQVDAATLRVVRRTETVVVPERGAELGNFGANAINESESWITVSEGMFMKDSAKRGAEGATFVARVLWSKPNRLAPSKP